MRQTHQAVTSRARQKIGVRIVVACVLVVAGLALLRRDQEAVRWSLARGEIQDTRVVADRAVETKWGGELTWKAEYRVVYFVTNREYAQWADSGIRGETEAAVRLALPQPKLPCRVPYNPKGQKNLSSIVDESRANTLARETQHSLPHSELTRVTLRMNDLPTAPN
jgi:hypothetical protein